MDTDLMVSIVIPIYNGEKYIDRIIEQLERQTYRHFEAIFVDDGSSDGTSEKLDALRIDTISFPAAVIHQENGGVSSARNRGLDISQGKYICFLDADDQVSSDYLELLIKAVHATGSKIAVGYICRELSELLRRHDSTILKKKKYDFLHDFLYHGMKYSLCSSLIRKECFVQFGLRFPLDFSYSEDVYVLWQLLAHVDFVAVVPHAIYYYYNNPVSAMNRKLDQGRLGAVYLMRRLEPFMEEYAAEFSPEFSSYAVARHHWSILWQAARSFGAYREFKAYCKVFDMEKELRKLFTYPEKRVSWSARLYCFSPRIYYHAMRSYLKIFRK